jgi:hypothetical protein
MRAVAQQPARREAKVGRLTAVWAVGFPLLVTAATIPAAGRNETSSASRFLAQQEQPLTHYRAVRRMHAHSERFNQEAWIEASTELDERGLRFDIISERGSDYMRNKVLKAVLKREQELIAEGHAARSTLCPANYEFTDAEASSDGVRYVLLKPKRKDVLLVEGRMVLSPDGTELLRVEGRLSKNPSFWTSSVNVIRYYGRLDGVRVPVSTESIAKVKFAGLSRLEVEYDYESINRRPVSVGARRLLASTSSKQAVDSRQQRAGVALRDQIRQP